MEWEVRIIERIQDNLGGISKTLSDVFSFIGGESGLMVMIVVTLFCWKKKTGQRLALIVASLTGWFGMIKFAMKRPRPYAQYPDRVKALSPVDPEASLTDFSAQGYSFPSMHSGAVAASYYTISVEARKKWFSI